MELKAPIPGNIWLWLILWINSLGFNHVGGAIKRYLGRQRRRKLQWRCGICICCGKQSHTSCDCTEKPKTKGEGRPTKKTRIVKLQLKTSDSPKIAELKNSLAKVETRTSRITDQSSRDYQLKNGNGQHWMRCPFQAVNTMNIGWNICPCKKNALDKIINNGLIRITIPKTMSHWEAPGLFTGKKDGHLKTFFD